MTLDEAIAFLRRGACSGEKRAECSTCAACDEAMRALVAEGYARAFGYVDTDERGMAAAMREAREVLP